jgi:hypothetical protein
MKFIISLLLVFMTNFSAKAVEIEFIGPCHKDPLLKAEVNDSFENVGTLTISVLEKFQAPHIGNEIGLHTAFNTPTGLEALEVISDEEMNSYGWCYHVDGILPESFPVEYEITPNVKKIRWFFGYARYFRGEWTDQCLESFKNPPAFLCAP